MHCHYCGSKVSKEDSVCKKCGYDLKNQIKDENQVDKKPYIFPYIVEVIFFSVVAYFITSFCAFGMLDMIKAHADDNSETILQQIYQAVLFSGEGTGFVIGILILFILWGIFKFNRIERRVIELSELIKKENIMKKLLILLLLSTLPSYSYEFCSEKLPEGCIGYDEGIHHLETYKQNGQFYIKIIPQQGYDFYKKIIPYGTNSKQMYKDFDRATEECMEERNYAFGLKDVDAYWDKANARTETQDISKYVNPTKIIY